MGSGGDLVVGVAAEGGVDAMDIRTFMNAVRTGVEEAQWREMESMRFISGTQLGDERERKCPASDHQAGRGRRGGLGRYPRRVSGRGYWDEQCRRRERLQRIRW